MAVTPEQLRNAAAMRCRRGMGGRIVNRYESAKAFINLIASNPMPTLNGLIKFGPFGNSSVISTAYYHYMMLTAGGKHSKTNIDRVYKMIHG